MELFCGIEILVNDKKILDFHEIYWIKKYKTNRTRFPEEKGLNLTDGGKSGSFNKDVSHLKKFQFEKGQDSWNKGTKCKYLDKLVEANTTRKYIYVYDINGYYITQYNAIKTASNELKISRCQISNIAIEKKGNFQAKGYQFRFFKIDKIIGLIKNGRGWKQNQ